MSTNAVESLYIHLDNGQYDHSKFPEEWLILDHDQDHRLIGIEILGDRAQDALSALADAINEPVKFFQP